ncbi:UvrD-helicase domain-containing protein [Oscillatoria sp. FACHB-1406]|uniref:UvrD-helicase domain-containing protein n=1 Tax=Oscillatoria sp. FACHB-1406 TaxID=2692846 RepID=UPI0016850E28|nr:UvrD-helicase domain-containing protein [Oscillatoria sp. FACHB-1406]MBD2579128.1 AAA family ATPase [Oscillatoria sp. FACHB-1406]
MQWIDFQQTVDQRLNREQLDEQQSRARNFNVNGHALVRGVAGSGKSLVLRNRVEKIVEERLNPVLVLSYNRFMRGWLKSTLEKKGLNVECGTFHQWGYRRIKYDYKYDRDDTLRKTVITLAEKSKLQYQSILVDEAQDFYDEWFLALLKILDPQTNSLFFVYDNTQSVYGQPHRRKSGWSWAKLRIDIVGRAQIFDLNYRNSPEILELAWKFIQPTLDKVGIRYDKRENNPALDRIIEPKKKTSRSSGVKPLLQQINFSEMPLEIAKQVKKALESCPDSSIGILTHPTYPNTKVLRSDISYELHQLGIRNHAPTRSEERDGNVVDRPYAIVDSWNALKGVEFDAVIIAGVDLATEQPHDPDSDFEEMAGLYTAMTRTRDHLVMLYEVKTPIVEQIQNALDSPDQLSYES